MECISRPIKVVDYKLLYGRKVVAIFGEVITV